MIEEDIEYLGHRIDNLESLIYFIAQKTVKTETIEHSEYCNNTAIYRLETWNDDGKSCSCRAEKIGDLLRLPVEPILSEQEIKSARQKYKETQKQKRTGRKKKRAKKK